MNFDLTLDRKTGNIVSFREAGIPFGKIERKVFLIITSTNISDSELFELSGSIFENYSTRTEAEAAVYSFYTELRKAALLLSKKDSISGLFFVPPEKQNELLQIKTALLNQYPKPIKINRRRYQIPIETIKTGWIPELDLKKLDNPEIDYQPMLDKKIIIDFAEKVAICKDKTTGIFKYSTVKVA